MTRKISSAVIRRLPKYYSYLDDLYHSGITRISSQLLAQKMCFTASKIRQDLNCFGGFGQQGYGYNVEHLRSKIAEILGLNLSAKAILLGTGNLGRALINNFDFKRCGFDLIAAFDIDKDIIGKDIHGISVFSMDSLEEFSKKHSPDIAILTLPSAVAVELVPQLERLGFKGIWNFAHHELRSASPSLKIENVHFEDSLMTLCYMISSNGKDKVAGDDE